MRNIYGVSKLFIFLFLFFSAEHFARAQTARPLTPPAPEWLADFTKVEIPGTQCGTGQAYEVYYRIGESNKALLHLQGGGACWNHLTCFLLRSGQTFLAPNPTGLTLFQEQKDNPVLDRTQFYFPYCTADTYVGTHTAQYSGKTLHHHGRLNLEKALAYLQSQGILQNQFDEVLVSGSSAGAIGALVNLDLWEQYFSTAHTKALLADAPGLHFSSSIWSRYSKEYLADYAAAFQRSGFDFDFSSGMLSPQIRRTCSLFATWRIGVVQSTRDFIMSQVFGKISPEEHRRKVLGDEGLVQTFQDSKDNCASYVPESKKHSSMSDPEKMREKTNDGWDIWRFLGDTILSFDAEFPSHL